MQLASEQAQQETQSTLELVRAEALGPVSSWDPPPPSTHTGPHLPQLQEKRQALEASVTELVRQVGDLKDHFLALSWRLDLQEQTLTQKLCEVRLPGERQSSWPGSWAPLASRG